MFFSENTIEDLNNEFQSIFQKRDELLLAYLSREFSVERAKEYAHHGFSRRIQTLVRCVERTFSILPPDFEGIPERNNLNDVTINIQSFFFNIFGAIDNLAWIWVHEKNITEQNGEPLRHQWVGLRSINKHVRNSFSDNFQKYLSTLDPWFSLHENYRHALAHRIPLYITPYVITPRTEEAYQELENGKFDAHIRGDYEEYDRLSEEQMSVVEFRPLIMHSLEEGAKPVIFHLQLLADLNTIFELGTNILDELNIHR